MTRTIGVTGRKWHMTVDVEGLPIVFRVLPADVQDRDGVPPVIVDMLKVVPRVGKLHSDGGQLGTKLRGMLEERTVADVVEIVEKPTGVKECTVLNRSWVVEPCLLGRHRRLAKDFARTINGTVAWVKPAA